MRISNVNISPTSSPIAGTPLVIKPAPGFGTDGVVRLMQALGTISTNREVTLAVDIFRPVLVPHMLAVWAYEPDPGVLVLLGRSGTYGDESLVVHICEASDLASRLSGLPSAQMGWTDPMLTLPGTFYVEMARLTPAKRLEHSPFSDSIQVPILELARAAHKAAGEIPERRARTQRTWDYLRNALGLPPQEIPEHFWREVGLVP